MAAAGSEMPFDDFAMLCGGRNGPMLHRKLNRFAVRPALIR